MGVDETTATGELGTLGAADWRDTFDSTSNWFLLDNDQFVWELGEDGGLLMKAREVAPTEQWGLSNRAPTPLTGWPGRRSRPSFSVDWGGAGACGNF